MAKKQHKKHLLKSIISIPKSKASPRVVVCGDPKRAATIAQRLSNSELITANREYHSYRGLHKGKDILVISHGVGASGAMICFQELIDIGAKFIIRLGTAGALYEDSQIGDIVIPTGAIRGDGISKQMVPTEYPAVPDLELTHQLFNGAKEKYGRVKAGIVFTTDLFYPSVLGTQLELYQKAGAVATEMECSALFVVGQLRAVRTAAVLSLDGNPLKWHEGEYAPGSKPLNDSIEKMIPVILEVLSNF